ncbi:hypothetical protein B0H14DRAFT_3057970 [Mycena olivaceomarginata]|nr:hypothetical protein B0H14DRAFT_3057970 [Mycena olivaceomarginata]
MDSPQPHRRRTQRIQPTSSAILHPNIYFALLTSATAITRFNNLYAHKAPAPHVRLTRFLKFRPCLSRYSSYKYVFILALASSGVGRATLATEYSQVHRTVPLRTIQVPISCRPFTVSSTDWTSHFPTAPGPSLGRVRGPVILAFSLPNSQSSRDVCTGPKFD